VRGSGGEDDPLKPQDIAREDIRGLTHSEIHPDPVVTASGLLAADEPERAARQPP